MSVFNRIAGTQEPKIPVWPIMMDITRLIDEEITFAELAAIYQLSPVEQAEIGEYLTAIGTILATELAIRTGLNWPEASANRDARVSVETVLRHALLRIEQGTMTLQQFRTVLGLSND